ncbi:hypothetical protein O7608_19615 [Solwaraspora sp. WMMA2056]|nr:hypothetical protein [Solwaraspora sp. WMMA2056]WJK38702.1 hypothetical protein O7608_19615 [Solwaraspora sp. WMMA2056]
MTINKVVAAVVAAMFALTVVVTGPDTGKVTAGPADLAASLTSGDTPWD